MAKYLFYCIQCIGLFLFVGVLSMAIDKELVYPYFSFSTAVFIISIGIMGVSYVKKRRGGIVKLSLGVTFILISIQQLILSIEKLFLNESNELWAAIAVFFMLMMVGVCLILSANNKKQN